MKERPIIFSGPMVRAILEGRKTQTRRVVKPQHDCSFDGLAPAREYLGRKHFGSWGAYFGWAFVPCPYGPAGTRLWVRETHYVERAGHDGETGFILYKASEPDMIVSRWRPSIHMPRWASRILLEVEDVRLERVQDISDLDALAEGIQVIGRTEVNDLSRGKFRHAFRALWDSINAKRGHGWDKNPWVWVVQFRVVNAQEA